MDSQDSATVVFAPSVVVNELKSIDELVDEQNERPEVVHEPVARIRAIAKDGRNMYEIERDEYHAIEGVALESAAAKWLGIDAIYIILDCLAPYAYTEQPYMPEILEWRDIMSAIRSSQLGTINRAVKIISEYMKPIILLSEPIPCAITTIGKIPGFDYDQATLMAAITARGDAGLIDKRILAAANTKGVWIQPGIIDPRTKAKSKHGRPAKSSGYRLFGTSQTTFWVKTHHRSAEKVFAVKVFQKNVNFETLGGLWADCRDTRDVNNTVLQEIKQSLDNPNIELSGFCASMRNYRFKLLTEQNIHLIRLFNIFRDMHATTHPNIFCEVDISRYPSAIVEIDVPNHTSKKKRITLKIFQSGKINLDSCVFPEHVTYWYRFINDFFIAHPEVLHYPPTEDEYDSDYYYEKAGVEPPPRELVDC
jgi:hypothetical protein